MKKKNRSLLEQTFEEVEPLMGALMGLIHDIFPKGTFFRVCENPCYFTLLYDNEDEPPLPIDYIEALMEGEFCIRLHIERCHIPVFFHASFPHMLPLLVEQVAYRWKQFLRENNTCRSDDWLFHFDAQCVYTYSQRTYVRYMHELMEEVCSVLPFYSRTEGDARFTGILDEIIEQPLSWCDLDDDTVKYYTLTLDIKLLDAYINSARKDATLQPIRNLFKQQIDGMNNAHSNFKQPGE